LVLVSGLGLSYGGTIGVFLIVLVTLVFNQVVYKGKIVTLFLAFLFLDIYSLVWGGQWGFVSFPVEQVDVVMTKASNILGYILLGMVFVRGKKMPRLNALDYWIILFFLWAVASQLWAVDASIASFNGFRFVQFIILYFLIRILVRTPSDVELYFRFILVSFIPLVIVVFLQYSAGFFGSGYGEGRPGTLASFVPYLLALTTLISGGKWLVWGSILLSIFLASFHGSRRILIAIVGYFGLHFRLRLGGFLIFGFLFIAGPYLYQLIPDTTRNRLDNSFLQSKSIYDEGADNAALNKLSTGRWEFWGYSIQMFKDHPITGVGLKNQVVLLDEYGAHREARAHNFYIEVLADLGIIGIILLFAIIYNGFKGLNKIRPSSFSRTDFLYHMVNAYKYEWIMIHFIALFGSSMFYNKSGWILYALVGSITGLNNYSVGNNQYSPNLKYRKKELLSSNNVY
jgi:O-antigen ligase